MRATHGALLFFTGVAAILVACGDGGAEGESPWGGNPEDGGGGSDGANGGDAGDRDGAVPRSGTRLRRVVVGPAGAPDRQLLDLRDTKIDLRCAPQHVYETTRCLPQRVVVGDVGLFSDATCSAPVASVPNATVTGSPACLTHLMPSTDQSTLVTLGASLDPAAGLFRAIAGTCESRPPISTYSYFNVTGTRPMAEFASFLEKADALATNLSRAYRVSEDGAVVEGEWFVPTLPGAKAACTPLPSTDGSTRCFPGSPIEIAYLDPQCTRPITRTTYTPGTAQERKPVSVGLRYESGTCPPKTHLFSLGAPIQAQQTFAIGSGGTCTVQPLMGDSDYQEVLAEIAPTALPEMAIPTSAAGRLSATYHAFGSARSLAYFTDGARSGAPCQFREAADGKLRCLPLDLLNGDRTASTFYLDATCTTPATFVTETQPMCGLNAVALLDRAGCPTKARWKVYELGPVAGPVYERSYSSCYMSRRSSARLRRLGAEVPPETFEEGVAEEE